MKQMNKSTIVCVKDYSFHDDCVKTVVGQVFLQGFVCKEELHKAARTLTMPHSSPLAPGHFEAGYISHTPN